MLEKADIHPPICSIHWDPVSLSLYGTFVRFPHVTGEITSNKWPTPQKKGKYICESWRYGIPGRTVMGRKRHGEKEGAYKSKNVNWSTSCGLNKCIIVREDYISVLLHHPHQTENVLWRVCVISVYTKMKNQQLRVIQSNWVTIIPIYLFILVLVLKQNWDFNALREIKV